MYRKGFVRCSEKHKIGQTFSPNDCKSSISRKHSQNGTESENSECITDVYPKSKKRKISKISETKSTPEFHNNSLIKLKNCELINESEMKKKTKKSILRKEKNLNKSQKLKKKVQKHNVPDLQHLILEPNKILKSKSNGKKSKRKKNMKEVKEEQKLVHIEDNLCGSFNRRVCNGNKHGIHNSMYSENELAVPFISSSKHFNTSQSDEEMDHGDLTDLIIDKCLNYSSEEEDSLKNSLNNLSTEFVDEVEENTVEYNTEEYSTELDEFEEDEVTFRKFRVGNDYCVVLDYSQSISIFGFCDISVLHGQINILGQAISPISSKYTVYSPRGTALLTIRNTSKFNNHEVPLGSYMPHVKDEDVRSISIRKDSSIILFSKKIDYKLSFVEGHISQKILPADTQCPQLKLEPSGPWNRISISDEWDKILDNICNASRVFVCGGKGVGKSTLLRYAINRLLQKFKEIRVVDLDPGQSEFTVPGTLSIVTVKRPLLGVNYTHLKEADRSVLCEISVSQDPHKYMKCLENLIKPLEEKQEFPTLINYMGFTNDMAFFLLSSAVVMLQPDKIVYIQSSNRKKNFKLKMTKETILQSATFFNLSQEIKLECDIIEVPSMTDGSMGWNLESRQVREMCLLAYFGQLMKEGVNSLQNCHLPAYVFDYTTISITNKDNVEVHVDAINANIVALCSLENEENRIFQCYGWGIVKAVDVPQHVAVIITPLGSNVLKKITHFVAGCISLPPSVCMNNENVSGKIPYVVEGELIDFAQMSKRTHIPFKTLRK